MIVFDVTNQESFDAVPKWTSVLKHIKGVKGCKGALVANKVDLTSRRLITSSQGEAMAKQCGLTYFETSAVVFLI